MSHNCNGVATPDFTLPGHSILALQGVDAAAFAQSQFMNDVAALADGQWQWNGWLTPKGRVIALFALLRLDAQTLWLLLHDAAATEFALLLQRYVFRSKLALKSIDGTISANFSAPLQARNAAFAMIDEGQLELDMSGEGGPRRLLIGAAPTAENHDAVTRWMQADLSHGLPRLPESQREQWTPQQLSLDRLRGFSVKKGCYPGQEIVARTHFLGQVKRGVSLYKAASEVAVGSDIVAAEDRSIGKIICTAGRLALGVVPLDAPSDGLHSAGIPLQAAALLGGLAR